MIWFLNTFLIFRYTLPVFPIHWFICGVWLHWINMSNARLEIKTWHGCFIWMYLWRKPTVFRKVLMAFSFYLIKLRSWAELLRVQPLLWKPLVTALSAPPTGRESVSIFSTPISRNSCSLLNFFVFCSNSEHFSYSLSWLKHICSNL